MESVSDSRKGAEEVVTRRRDVMRREHRRGATPALIVEPPPRYALGCGLHNDAPSSQKRWEAVLSAPLPLHVATGFFWKDLSYS
jgi:hypothetical protein